jgi:hypothetical protein
LKKSIIPRPPCFVVVVVVVGVSFVSVVSFAFVVVEMEESVDVNNAFSVGFSAIVVLDGYDDV